MNFKANSSNKLCFLCIGELSELDYDFITEESVDFFQGETFCLLQELALVINGKGDMDVFFTSGQSHQIRNVFTVVQQMKIR